LGRFWRFVLLEEKRPFAVPKALKRAWIRPSGVRRSSSDLPYALRIFSISFHRTHFSTLGSSSIRRFMAS